MNVKLLDCTLRDGGFINDWNFGHSTILSILKRLVNAGIDNIEIGFINDQNIFNIQRTINPSTSSFDKIFKNMKKGKSRIFAMIDFGTCDISNIEHHNNDSFIDGIRVIFKKKDIPKALDFCKEIKEKGYLLSINPVSITTYTDLEMLQLVEKINEINPYVMSIVDTYGLMHKEKMIHYFYLINNNLNPEIKLGYHSHNNFQLAYSNSIELLNVHTQRTLILDGSLYGMGKSAGNACTELLAMYLNENYNKNYDISELLEVIDIDILKIRQKYEWGYTMSGFVAALNDCHPNYVKYLREKNTLSAKSIDEIVKRIAPGKKLTFSKEHIENLYLEYQQYDIDDNKDIQKIGEKLRNREILLLGPGKSIIRQQDTIIDFIEKTKPVVISINHVSDIYDPDYVFISNAKRYEHFSSSFKEKGVKVIATSNLTPLGNDFDYILNYGRLINNDPMISDNSMSMILTLFKDMHIKKLSLAGFDGYISNKNDYYDEYLAFSHNNRDMLLFNHAIASQLKDFQKFMKIEFLTPSEYQNKLEEKTFATN